ncbi:MAG: pyridoxal-phosphate dependent enzyme [Gemmatimonadetes bacterium]|nr:pyridoxal-phosphate dependent enzyme [Gemmatimonadota bacterium]
MTAERPSFSGVLEARSTIAGHLAPTALHPCPALGRLLGADVFVKHENHQPVGAFKVRGGVNLVSRLDASERRAGLVTASTGNHGQSIAYAAKRFGVEATVCVPIGANPLKLLAIRDLGASIVEHGRDFDEAREFAESMATDRSLRYVHSGNEPLLIEGVGTLTLEILEEQPDVDTVIVPVGGGSGAAGACIVARAMRPAMRVIGVQSEAAPAAHRSWQAGSLFAAGMATCAEGLATRTAFEMPQRILREHLHDFVLVTDDEIRHAMAGMIAWARTLAEAAGAAPLAAALRLRDSLAGRCVALVCTGGNVTLAQLRDALAASSHQRGDEDAAAAARAGAVR